MEVLRRVREEGLSYRYAATLFDIRRFNVIAEWEQRYEEGGLNALADRRRKDCVRNVVDKIPADPPPNGEDLMSREELVAELNRLRAENAYLKKPDALALANKQLAPHSGRK
jgi:transposase